VVGAGLAGSPGIPIGHNGVAAWGVTAGLTDNTDLYVETLEPDGRSTREPGGQLAPCTVVREVIRVKGGVDVVEEVLVTPRGPVVSPPEPGRSVALSLRAVWLDPLPVNGFLGMKQARSFDEFRKPFEHWPLLPLNLLYADTTGTTGYQLVGQLPRRASGTSSLLPRPADRADAAWVGLVPFEEMPNARDFPTGYFATANNPPVGTGPELGADYCEPYRVRAITEALAAKDQWATADCLALQRSVRSIPWEELRDIVLSLPADDGAVKDGLALLRAWDGRVDSESPAACVFELFLAEMCQRVAKAKAPNSWAVALGEGALEPLGQSLFTDRRVGHLLRLLRDQPAGWFASWPGELAAALREVVRRLRRDVGPGPAYWAWGHLRRLRLEHPLFANHRWLGPAFNLGPFPCSGDCNTVSQAGARPADPTAFTHNMANLRTVFDLADLAQSRFVLCGGQSGNPLSDHHADLLPLWQAGEAITIPWHQADVIRAAKDTLRLLPDPAKASGDRGASGGRGPAGGLGSEPAA
jgi:penicillin amidase